MADHRPGALLGRGKEADVFEMGDHVIKLYRSQSGRAAAFREAAILAIVSDLQIPVPQVTAVGRYEGRWGLVMTKAEGRPVADDMQIPAKRIRLLQLMAKHHLQIHTKFATNLPAQKSKLRHNIETAPLLDEITRRRLLERLASLPTGTSLCHGDYHPFNLLGRDDHLTIVDWLDASGGNPAADVCRSYLLMQSVDLQLADSYVSTYCSMTGLTLDRVLDWLPIVAGARLAEGIDAENDQLLAIADAG